MPSELRDLARAHGPAALSCLADIMSDRRASPSSRIAAACALLDRGYGRALTPMVIEDKPIDQMSDDELRAVVREAALELGPSLGLIVREADTV